MQDGGHLLGRAYPKARGCGEEVSGLFSFRGSGRGLPGLEAEEGAARRDAEALLRPPPFVAALLIGPAAAAPGPTVQPPTGCRRRRSGGPGGWRGRGLLVGATVCRGGGCPLGPGGSSSPEKPGTWVLLLRDLRAALELKLLKWTGAGTCSDSARLLLPKLRLAPPRALCPHSPAFVRRSRFSKRFRVHTKLLLARSWRPAGRVAPFYRGGD